jgi:hypothetical protein
MIKKSEEYSFVIVGEEINEGSSFIIEQTTSKELSIDSTKPLTNIFAN